ncbi:hypothetical protein BGZ80_010117 [Entomortierella chlamydospora]|uniref:Uncharacterized protein n=1 Tax=Entomortierella chlamydospora TaxID=101097 RepID=A0A9P6MV70_9FUNG|nr:hypothetical protein BGZ79_003364 [Entomortierella chlamydospora]KAG0014993.1 hypothetical protein BGZ80_010117 [Entomortierella chlamydospora]
MSSPISSHAIQATPTATSAEAPVSASAAGTSATPANTSSTTPAPHIRIVPHLDAPRSLHFEVVDKDVPEGFVLKIGRFTDKQSLPNRVTFKSKVVSRGHAEIFTENGKFFIRDTKSSSGTFLNHARLSPPGVESKPTPLKDGDVIQLGVDYQGGTQEIYRCVKMRLELNRSWQQHSNPFRENTLKAIRSLTTADASCSTDCCICLFRIASFQSLFVAPCSHVYHYKCIRPMLVSNHPGFLCPLCRTFADLEDPVEIDDPIEENKPVQSSVAAAADHEVPEDNPIEQIVEAEPTSPTQPEQTSTSTDAVSAPTPTSAHAHTSQAPENAAMQLDTAGSGSDSEGSSEAQPVSAPSPSSSPSPVQQQSLTSATVPPMNIAGAGSPTPVDSTAQQSPSSAFFMAPSPPMFGSSLGVSPISFAATSTNSNSRQPSTSSQHQHSSSPTSHMGHMFQNFVRNITIPHRNRSRTNSNPATPTIASNTNSTGQPQISGSEVYGKTLVMTPPSIPLVNNRTGTGHSGSELGVVTEMDVEQSFMNDQPEGDGNESSSSSSGGRNSSRSSSQSRDAHHHLEESAGAALHNSHTITAEATV